MDHVRAPSQPCFVVPGLALTVPGPAPKLMMRRACRPEGALSPPRPMIRFEDIYETVRQHHPGADLELLRKAYVFSTATHAGSMRISARMAATSSGCTR